jgi:DNA-binding transcriptional LysR family regulator
LAVTLEQLRIFVTVAEHASMTRAAEALHLTQSAVSASVAALEHRHGTRLFDRVGRGLALSQAGAAFLPDARAVLRQAKSAAATLDDLAGLRRGVLSLFASQTVASYWLPSHMVAFARAYPGLDLTLSVGNTAQVARAVLEGEAELGFVEGGVSEPALAHRRIGSDRLVILAATDHPLARASHIDWSDLAAATWVRRELGSGTRSEFEQILTGHGINPANLERRIELPSNEAVLAAVKSGGLLAAVSELAARPMIDAGQIVRLPLELPLRHFELLVHKERRRSRAGAAFIDRLTASDSSN